MKFCAPETVTFTSNAFCPGCGHGIAARLIAEISEEMGLDERIIAVVDVACCALHMESWHFDTVMAAHGRPIAAAIGVKKTRPDNAVFAYIGDGAAYSIGIAETMHAAIRNDHILVIVINNALYGMTGGQMAPTTLPGQRTASSPKGKDPARYGEPFNIVDAFSGRKIAYLARAALSGPAEIIYAKRVLKTAFQKHVNGEGLCFVELLSPCPTNLHLSPVDAMKFVRERMTEYFPLGEFIGGKEKRP